MPKPPGASELSYRSPNVDHDKDMAEHGAPAGGTKIVFWILAILLVVLAVLVSVALHVPSGESP